jgi:pimeloyl-ACP methyl ester carboxylesterase
MKLHYTILLLVITSRICSQNEIHPKEKNNSSTSLNIQVFAEREATLEYFAEPDSTGLHARLKMPQDPNAISSKSTPILPYPIIFIHGLISSSDTWNSFTDYLDSKFGFTYGGRLDYCLNFDRNDSTANTLSGILSGKGKDMGSFSSTLIPGDYYCVNFDVGYNGSVHPNGSTYDVRSNQSAIAKQGMAVKWAIKAVLEATGRDKVILMGHSMGGLASREYLQNPDLWQADGAHHVAKLVTTGTPHGGSNTTSYGLPIGGLSEQSEAIRDLRASYYYSKDRGVYLWGGSEIQNTTSMNDNRYGFYNVDVNCNETNNEKIIGLNEKNIPADVDYACIVGKCTGCLISSEAGDGVVAATNADLKIIYTTAAIQQFYYETYAAIEIHTSLPGQVIQNMQGLDEPNEFNLEYNIALETNYKGFTTVQSIAGKPDEDHYQFNIQASGSLSVQVNKTDLTDLTMDIYDASYTKICPTVHSSGSTTINYAKDVLPGYYHLVFTNLPTNYSYLHPYNFIVNNTTTGIEESYTKNIFIYPNPVSNLLNLYLENYGSMSEPIIITDCLGQEVMKTAYSTSLDVSKLSTGVYFMKIKRSEEMEVIRFVKD